MLNPFRLKRPIGPDSVMDRDDVLNAKRALNALGYLEAPDYGLTPYPDEPMIKAVKGFQRRHRLRVDGIINPDGPTAEVLGRVIAGRQHKGHSRRIVEGEWDWLPEKRRPPRRYPGQIYYPEFPDRRRPTTIFDILAEIGLGRRNDPRDVLAARRALAWSGHLPRETATDRTGAGADLFDAVRAFQRASGLKSDGWMGPGGETARALDKMIAPKVRDHLQAMARDAEGTTAERSGTRVAKMDKPPFPGMRGPEGAMINNPWLGGGGAAIGAGIAAQELLRQQRKQRGMEGEAPPATSSGGTHPRTDMAPPRPPLPGFEPPKDQLPTKEEVLPARDLGPPTEIFPDPGERKAVLESFPDQSDELVQALILESRGNKETQRDTDYVIVAYDRAVKRWKLKGEHTKGGHTPDDKQEYRSERVIQPIGGVRGARPDGTFEIDDGEPKKIKEDLQTVDTLKDGLTPDARERGNAARIELLKLLHGERGSVGLFPKSRGKDRAQWEKEIDAMVENHFRKRYGRPPDER